MSAHRSPFKHTSEARSDGPVHADDGRKDVSLLHNEQPMAQATDETHRPDAAVDALERLGNLSDHAHCGSQLPDGVIPYSRPRRAHPPAPPLGRVQHDEGAVSPLPEPSAELLPTGQRCTLTDGERAALVERMLPAYRALLRSGDQIPVQDKGHTVHSQGS
jgi:hypothetical protein